MTESTTRTTCTACGAPLVWVVTVGGRRMPLDPDPHPAGNVVRVAGRTGPRARVLTGGEMPAQETAWRAHFTTCPNASEFRRRKAAAAPRCTTCGDPMNAELTRRTGWTEHPACPPPTRRTP